MIFIWKPWETRCKSWMFHCCGLPVQPAVEYHQLCWTASRDLGIRAVSSWGFAAASWISVVSLRLRQMGFQLHIGNDHCITMHSPVMISSYTKWSLLLMINYWISILLPSWLWLTSTMFNLPDGASSHELFRGDYSAEAEICTPSIHHPLLRWQC